MEGYNFQNTEEGQNQFPKEEEKEEVCDECGKQDEECECEGGICKSCGKDCEECQCEAGVCKGCGHSCKECDCEEEEEEDEEEIPDELDTEEVAVEAYNRIDALVEILIKKGIITEEELEKMEDQLLEEDEEDSSSENHSFQQNSAY